ncbi:hypothetical protein F7734_24360 [Scytonema sp. UIC 10036]|uniref:DUF6887 family protein n=1 Tax=Scytonema sp. UIC 10036 TaxID=2304196 RepID=UPI0012DA4213|nr:hypothetical protein [Scytonema sp. UIC 10036]MUG95327.1 hypothetical protein [Scytonema sp. UIC 10036]
MTKLNYNAMSDNDLLNYVKQHPEDNEAFYTYIDRKRAANPNPKPMSIEEAEAELQRRVSQHQAS